MERRGAQRFTGPRALAAEGAFFIAGIVAACNPSPATETPRATSFPTESPVPTMTITPTEIPTQTPEVTATPEPTPATTHIADGKSYFDSYTQWKKDNTKAVTLTSLESGAKNLLTSPAFKDSADKDVKDIYDYLVTQKNLQVYFDDLAGKLQAQDQNSFMGGCVDMTKFMAIAN